MQKFWKNMRENHKYFEITLGIFWIFFLFFELYNIILLNINWAGPNLVQLDPVGLARLMAEQTLHSFFFWGRLNPAHLHRLDQAQARTVTSPA
jgi:hypothetical protein